LARKVYPRIGDHAGPIVKTPHTIQVKIGGRQMTVHKYMCKACGKSGARIWLAGSHETCLSVDSLAHLVNVEESDFFN